MESVVISHISVILCWYYHICGYTWNEFLVFLWPGLVKTSTVLTAEALARLYVFGFVGG